MQDHFALDYRQQLRASTSVFQSIEIPRSLLPTRTRTWSIAELKRTTVAATKVPFDRSR